MLVFSTHTFTEGDGIFETDAEPGAHFNSRLHGRRLELFCPSVKNILFQLTPSRKATFSCFFILQRFIISTHAFTEGDFSAEFQCTSACNFNSRLHGRRPVILGESSTVFVFQLTPSRKATATSNNNCF